ncbi:hypothetical protein CERSUDRAFT_108969 [Gelatoporia subvermispora B]|uniref:NACHT domain-containing protein n=1 Tax=Ceriporiopsis subvermispora (strain B) TaxID=914234 RepID=M2QZM3_CERS8|nr:hypothetical protein CERSUDRAFT_108969 [Gelatoporia subvermispora B]
MKCSEFSQLMRANVKTKEDVISRIQALRDLLVAIAEDVTAEVGALSLFERNQAEGEVQQSPLLKWRIKAFIERLEVIRNSAEARQRIRWYQRFWFAEPEAEFLKDLGRDIDNAKNNFELEGSIEIRKHVVELVMSTHEICRQMKEKAMQEILDGLNPANATYTSALIEEKSRLQEGTRTAIRADLAKWAVDSDPEKRIYVLYGQAGMGKSSIAHAFCKELQGQHFVASFFFLRGHDTCSDAYRVFPTIAYQLADKIPEVRPHIVKVARKHRAGYEQALDHQFRTLILNPLKALAASIAPSLLIFVFDGVDECSNTPDTAVSSMLRLLCEAAHELPFLRIFIATRPETYILDALRSLGETAMLHWRDLQREENIDHDIRLFIRTELERSAAAGGFPLLADRPNATDVLTQLADGLFIWARTVIRFLVQHKYLATRNYDILLASQEAKKPSGIYAQLDELYMTILNSAFDRSRGDEEAMHRIRLILAWITTRRFRLGVDEFEVSPEGLSVTGTHMEVTVDVMDRLRAVLIVDGDLTVTTTIRACYASFPQFLSDSARCTDPAFLVDPPSGHAMIATSLLDLLARDDVDSLRDADGDMPEMWGYAILRWDDHLCDARYTPELGRALRGFVETHLEDWLQQKAPWDSHYGAALLVELCREVRTWCKMDGPDDGLVAALDTIIDRRVKEIVAEAARGPDEYLGDPDRIKVWAEKGYTPEGEGDAGEDERE